MSVELSNKSFKHAYLILAHNEFGLLELLVERLDDARNDIYIHIDAKVAELPKLKTHSARLFFISERYDVRWGDVSVLKAEFALFRIANRESSSYSYYHLLSGVDLPLKSQDYIHSYCAQHQGAEFIGFYEGENKEAEIYRKVRIRHLFPGDFRGSGIVCLCKRIIRALYIRLQILLGINRYPNMRFDKGTQWVSITDSLVSELLKAEQSILSIYEGSFCSDEIAIQSFVANSEFMERVYDRHNEGRSAMRYIGWQDGVLVDFEEGDLERLQTSEAFFARKFNSRNMDFISKVLKLSE